MKRVRGEGEQRAKRRVGEERGREERDKREGEKREERRERREERGESDNV